MRNQWEHAPVIPRETEKSYFAVQRTLDHPFETHTHDFFVIFLLNSDFYRRIIALR